MKSLFRPAAVLGLFCSLLFLLSAAPAHAAKGDTDLAASVAKLEKLGVIDDAAYWLENARGKRTCDGAKVGALILAAAKRNGKATDLDSALNVLIKRRTITKADYWAANAVPGKTCSGGQVGSLLSRIAKTTK